VSSVRSKKVVVLGGSGFIGTRLVGDLREAGADVVIGDIRRSERYPELWRECDVTVLETLPPVLREAEVVVNLAAEHRDDVRPISRYYDVNVYGAEVVSQAAAQLGIGRLVFTSSVAVYGLPKGVVRECDTCMPFNEYGRTKLLAEGVYKKWWSEDESRSLVIVRPTVVFGEGNRGNVYNLLRQIHSGRFLMVGDGRNHKSLAYVGNVAAFLAHALEAAPGLHLYNYADGPDFDMNSLTSHAAKRMGRRLSSFRMPYAAGYAVGSALDLAARVTRKSFPLSAIRVKKFCANTQFSAERAFASGFKPAVSLTEALARVIQADFPEAA
jgi:nucleoside-diphosphate-sugar epimerase